MHSNVLSSEETALVVVDVQEAFRAAIPVFSEVVARIRIAIRGFDILGLPIIVTEQYPKGLGRTAAELLEVLPEKSEISEKSTFSSCGASDFLMSLNAAGARQIALCGIETHICVNQTAHDLIDSGFHVHLLTDAVASRFERDRRSGIDKIFASGGIPSSVEMALFELMRDSQHENFKAIQALVK
ncbi:MAG TPA: isochorismatase family protein [Pyrinomonadaceae bacterium]|nr:isochorismatase family protein [Pyrinomonadaceae bacterium]